MANLKQYVIEQMEAHLEELAETGEDFLYEFDVDVDNDVEVQAFLDEWREACAHVAVREVEDA